MTVFQYWLGVFVISMSGATVATFLYLWVNSLDDELDHFNDRFK